MYEKAAFEQHYESRENIKRKWKINETTMRLFETKFIEASTIATV